MFCWNFPEALEMSSYITKHAFNAYRMKMSYARKHISKYFRMHVVHTLRNTSPKHFECSTPENSSLPGFPDHLRHAIVHISVRAIACTIPYQSPLASTLSLLRSRTYQLYLLQILSVDRSGFPCHLLISHEPCGFPGFAQYGAKHGPSAVRSFGERRRFDCWSG